MFDKGVYLSSNYYGNIRSNNSRGTKKGQWRVQHQDSNHAQEEGGVHRHSILRQADRVEQRKGRKAYWQGIYQQAAEEVDEHLHQQVQ